MALESPDYGETRIDVGAVLGAVWARLLRIVLVTVLLLAATYAVLLFVPKLYESSAGILVEPRPNAFTTTPNQPTTAINTGLAPGVVSSQIELLKSPDTLRRVIEAEDLKSVPEFNTTGGGPLDFIFRLLGRSPSPTSVDATVLNNLLDRLTVIQERDSAIISVLVRSRDPELAARLANAIAKAHVERRSELEISDTAEASVWLEDEIETLTQRVAEAENKVAAFKVEHDLFQGVNNTSLLDQKLSGLATQISTARERQITAQSRADLIRGLIDAGQPIDGVPDVRDSLVIQQLSQSRVALQGERAQRSATLLASHPTIQALDAQIAELARQINNEASRVADALEVQATIEAETVAGLEAEIARLKVTAGTAATQTVQLQELEREAKAQRDLLESYLLRYRDAVSRTNASSAFPDVRVITEAVPSQTPASPKTMFILVAVGLVSVALQVGSIIFSELLSGRALRSRYATDVEPVIVEPDEIIEDQVADESLEEAEEAEVPEESGPEFEPEVAVSEPDGVDAWEGVETTPTGDDAEYEPEFAFTDAADESGEPEGDKDEESPELAGSSEPKASTAEEERQSLDLSNLVADVALGRVQVVMLAALDQPRDASAVSEILIEDAAMKGLSVCIVDAGSSRMSSVPGVTDLSAERASYGDVVHKSGHEGLAEVPWGTLPAIDRRSTKPAVLVDALTDIYEVVIVLTGRVGMASSLPLFASIPCRLVFVAGDTIDTERLETAEADARALGFDIVQVVDAPAPQAEVA